MRNYPENDQDWLAAKKLNAEIWMFDALKLNTNFTDVVSSARTEYRRLDWDLNILSECRGFYFSIDREKGEPAATLSLILLMSSDKDDVVIRDLQEDDLPFLYRELTKVLPYGTE